MTVQPGAGVIIDEPLVPVQDQQGSSISLESPDFQDARETEDIDWLGVTNPSPKSPRHLR